MTTGDTTPLPAETLARLDHSIYSQTRQAAHLRAIKARAAEIPYTDAGINPDAPRDGRTTQYDVDQIIAKFRRDHPDDPQRADA